ncbi:IQ domain-containing protein G isoform X2 [Zootermopsis nevadensis]|uniref:IQ domain-containing protein G isoform X2 n=1 Tax=Zootermopsis nevadensis TaxID=136037 RepID=UPI000B8E8431|nr:IQ domain-containing protein G isoform X2 [Zootermopsis nevadensis]
MTDFIDEERNPSQSGKKSNVPKTMADVVMMARSMMERKKKMPVAVSKDSPGRFVGQFSPHTAGLLKIERIGVISVLEDCTDQLSILRKINATRNFPADIKYRSLKEWIRLEEVLHIVMDELTFQNSFKTLVEISKFEEQKQSEEAELRSIEKKNVKKINNLHMMLKTEFKKGMDELNERHDTVARLKDQIQETLFMNDLKFKYVSKWEAARIEQNCERLSLSEKILEDQLTDLKDNIDMEMRCHVEIEMYMKHATTNLEKEIKNWMEKYGSELEERAADCQKLQAKRAVTCKELEDLLSLYQQHQNEIDAYLAHKEKEAAKAAHEAHLYCMATVIQAWWRGTMVRRGLGPYKKSKKGKDRKGKAKGRKEGIKKKI